MKNVLLDELEGPGPVLELGGQAVGQLGALELTLARAQRRVNVGTHILDEQMGLFYALKEQKTQHL